jgi:mannosyltransferase OCH1-like enzyme
MIAKKIHYIWLGKNKKPKTFDMVLTSWEKHAPHFEIIEWNEDTIGEFELPIYYHTLMKQKKWAFASDILRFYILRKYGGVYFDIDQVLVKDFPEKLLENNLFISQYHERTDYYGFGLLGISSGHQFSDYMCTYYKTYSSKHNVIVNKVGSEYIKKLIEKQETGICILPQEYFYPLTKEHFTENTYSYHLSNTSWIPTYKKVLQKLPYYDLLKKVFLRYAPQNIVVKLGKNVEY